MAKRVLTRHQKWRIEKIQQDRINRANKKSTLFEKQLDDNYQTDISHQHNGLVIKNYGQSLDIEDKQGLYRCSFRQNLGAIVAGDEVVWNKLHSNKQLQSSSNHLKNDNLIYDGVVIAVQERHSLLARPDSYGNKKTIAANIDQILIINAPTSIATDPSKSSHTTPRLNTGLIDRYLLSAESNQIQAVIVINKIDLLTDNELAEIKNKLCVYKNLGYEIVYTSALTQPQLPELVQMLSNKNSIFVGQSGVGKSSLLNFLLPDAQAKTATVSTANAKGRHTTSAAQLYHLEKAGIENATLIDSPGIREFGLWDITKEDINNGFKEIKEFSKNCRFRDCQHEKEPDCAILKALDEQLIGVGRYNSYKKIINSLS
ncbi:MAG: small ribosomal subunit biogenesis GTPase RsgA [Pseudomonadota bacterium]